MSARFRTSVRHAVAGGITIVLGLSLASSVTLPATDRPGTAPSGPVKAAPPRIGELPERRTQTSATRRNSDGSMTTTVSTSALHYRADGRQSYACSTSREGDRTIP